MTRNEFKKFIKSLKKADLIKIILDQTKDNPDLEEEIFLTYTPEEITVTPVDYRQFVNRLHSISDQFFGESIMVVEEEDIDKYCEIFLQLIKSYIQPLVKRGLNYDAYHLLLEVYFEAFNALNFLDHPTPSTGSFFSKVRRGLNQIVKQSNLIDKFKIENLIFLSLFRDDDTLWNSFELLDLLREEFAETEWPDVRDELLEQLLDQFMDEMDFTKPAPDDFSELAQVFLYNLLDEGSEEKIKAHLEKYKFLGNIIRFKAHYNLDHENFQEAEKVLREAKSLPTLSQEQLHKNSDLLIEVLLKQAQSTDDQDKSALLAELKENLDYFPQDSMDNFTMYVLYLDEDLLDEAFSEYSNKETTKFLYTSYMKDFVKSLKTTIKALKQKDFKAQADKMEAVLSAISVYEPELVADFLTEQIRELADEKPSKVDYSKIGAKLTVFLMNSDLDEDYQKLKKELRKKYPNRRKLRELFNNLEQS